MLLRNGCNPFSRQNAAEGLIKLRPRPSIVRANATSGEVGPKKPKRGGMPGPAVDTSAMPPAAAPHRPPPPAKAPPVEEPALEEVPEEEQQFLAPFMDAVIKVYAIHTEPSHSLPWQKKRQMSSTSSGFVVSDGDKRYLLTNAHSVEYYTQVKVKRRGDDRKFLAQVLSIGVDCDIALLDVEAPEFWEGLTPLQFGPLPRLQDAVAVVGYPIGGDTQSVTAGVVSRIEVTDYSHGSTDLLAIQIDAAINGGNSGGPVFNRLGQCIGIAFQALVGEDIENVGYVIPTPVVQHFLTDYERTGSFSGFPAMGIQWQRMESEALRRWYKMQPGQKGVLLRKINPTSDAANVLKEDDVLMRFDGVDISCDGTVPFRTGERIAFSYLISNKYVGDTCTLDVLRDGEMLTLPVKLSKPKQIVPPHIGNRDPSYFMVSGLVFTVCTEKYLQSEYGGDYGTQSPVKLLERMYHGFPGSPEEELVVLSQVLACDATLGYEDIYNVQLVRFNGQPIANLRQLAEAVTSCTEPFMRFDLEYGEFIVVETDAARASTQAVMASHSVPFPMSSDLRRALMEAPAPAPAQ